MASPTTPAPHHHPGPSLELQTHLLHLGRPPCTGPSLLYLCASSHPPSWYLSLRPCLSPTFFLTFEIHLIPRPASLSQRLWNVSTFGLLPALCPWALSLPSCRPVVVLLGPGCDRLPATARLLGPGLASHLVSLLNMLLGSVLLRCFHSSRRLGCPSPLHRLLRLCWGCAVPTYPSGLSLHSCLPESCP